MSTLRVSTIQDTAGSNSSTPAAIANGIAKAWANINGQTNAIRASFNVSSITDLGSSQYRVNFTTAFADANYSGVFSYSACYIAGTGYGSYGYINNQTAASFEAIMAVDTSAVSCTYEPINLNFTFFR